MVAPQHIRTHATPLTFLHAYVALHSGISVRTNAMHIFNLVVPRCCDCNALVRAVVLGSEFALAAVGALESAILDFG